MALLVLPTVAPEAARVYGVPAALIGYQISLVSAGMLISLMVLGNLSRRLGGCRTYQLGQMLVALGLGLMLLPALACLIAGSLAIGVGYGLLTPAASYLLMRFTPERQRNTVFSVQQAGVPLGGIIVAAVAPTIAIAFGWRWALGGAAALLLTVAIALQMRRTQWDDDRDPATSVIAPSPFAAVTLVWRQRRLRLTSIAGGCLCWAQFCVSSFTVVACVEGLGYGLVQAGFMLTLAQVAGISARLACGFLADRIGSAAGVLVWLAGVMLLACAASAAMSPAWPLFGVCALFAAHGATSSGWPGALLAESGRLSPRGQISSTISGSLVYINFGKLIGPIVFANVYAVTHDYGFAFASVGVPALAALLCLLAALRH
jgi:MFS family permease